MRVVLPILIALTLTIGLSSQETFAFTGQGTLYATEPYRCELWTIDPSNGDAVFIANTEDGGNPIPLPSLAVHPSTGVMYAGGGGSNVSCEGDLTNRPNLYIVNPNNGDLTFVGATNEGNLVGLDFRSDGTLFAAVKVPGVSGGSALGIVNTATGNTIIVGSFGFTQINGIAFFGNTLYGVSYNEELYTIDTTSGEATLVVGVSQEMMEEVDLGAAQFACGGTFYVGRGAANSDFGILDILSGVFNQLKDDPLDETMGGLSFSQTCHQVGGTLIPIDSTFLLLAGTQMTASWLIPVIVSAVGIGLVFVRKSEKS